MRLSHRRLNRTLLRRQHLLERVDLEPHALAEHLVGLQAQENLAPYLSMHARLTSFDPHAVSRGLEDRSLVRLLAMRGTLHLLTADDALALRPWTQATFERVLRTDPRPQFERALVQTPPRGTWKGTGGVDYVPLEEWVGEPLREPDVPGTVRRYLRAFGPATAGDLSVWAGVTRLRPLVLSMDDLVRHEDESGTVLFDVADAPIEDEDAPAPVRLLGTYDNVWLAHADRDRVTAPGVRRQWLGANGGTAATVFVDGWLTGLWRVVGGRVSIETMFRDLTPGEQEELDEEVQRVEALLARPAVG